MPQRAAANTERVREEISHRVFRTSLPAQALLSRACAHRHWPLLGSGRRHRSRCRTRLPCHPGRTCTTFHRSPPPLPGRQRHGRSRRLRLTSSHGSEHGTVRAATVPGLPVFDSSISPLQGWTNGMLVDTIGDARCRLSCAAMILQGTLDDWPSCQDGFVHSCGKWQEWAGAARPAEEEPSLCAIAQSVPWRAPAGPRCAVTADDPGGPFCAAVGEQHRHPPRQNL